MTLTPTPVSPVRDLALGDFLTERGGTVRHARLRYRTYGDPECGAEHGWVLVFHALTGSHEVHQWWGPLLESGKILDPARRPILAANLLGSCYGSSSPRPGDPSAEGFPDLSPGDLARAHALLLEELGIGHLALALGGSLGGMVALEWARRATVPTEGVVVFAAPAATSAQSIAWNAAQRMAIEADPAWQRGRYAPGAGPTAGLAAARAIAMITYRSGVEFEGRFGRESTRARNTFDAEYYLRRQGEKLVARFDAASYVSLMRSMDLHDVGDRAIAARETRGRVRRLIGVGIDTDILYYPAEVLDWVETYAAAGVDARYREIRSPYGHDAFLIEWDQVEEIIREALGEEASD
jgi:homoserine O-acetyltransferase